MTSTTGGQMGAQELARQLEWELSLAGSELVSHGWYRGALGRVAAEAALPADGHFLVRDSASQPGNYVLSCRHAGQHLHFVINRVVIQPETVYERFQYQFEDEAYDTVPDLVTSYVGSGKPISVASGARIQTPSNRQVPLLCCSNRGANHTANVKPSFSNQCRSTSLNKVANHTAFKPISLSDNIGNQFSGNIYNVFQNETPGSAVTPTIYYKRQQSAPISPTDSVQADKNITDYVFQDTGEMDERNSSASGIVRGGSWDGWEAPQGSPPAKPARAPPAPPAYQASGSDSGNGSGDSAQSSAPGDTPRIGDAPRIAKPLKREIDAVFAEECLMKVKIIEFKQVSKFNVDDFQTSLFASAANKPLESDTLQTIKVLLRSSGPRILANHLTTIDLKIILGENKALENANPLESLSGIELCLLPNGHQMRLDLLERTECLKLLIAVTILTCQSDVERADVLNDWIQLAIETKTALGNLFGFAAIMLGLCMPQVQCLEAAWFTLRQRHTDAAFTFEAKLRPCFKSMNDCVDPSPPNTTLPHLMPSIMLMNYSDADRQPGTHPSCWEFPANSSDFGFSIVASHLETARKFPDQIQTFKRNARTVVQEMSSLGAILDPMLLELFHTEFHMKFLWGCRGALVPSAERHGRLTQVLTTMAQKYPSHPPEKTQA